MAEKDFIKELFADKLANAEAPVNPELWNAISAKVATQTAVSAGLSTTAKLIIGLGTAATITVASVLYFNQNEEKAPKKDQKELSSNSQAPAGQKEESILNTSNGEEKIIQPQQKQAASQNQNSLHEEERHEFTTGPLVNESQEYEKTIDAEEKSPIIQEVKPVYKNKEATNPDKAVNNPTAAAEKITEKSSFEIGELPNIFTPNNDNENDYFFIPVKGMQDFVLTVLNQNNEIVFRTTDPNFKWDGRDMQGNLVPSGTKFVYFFTGKSSQGDSISKYNQLEIRY